MRRSRISWALLGLVLALLASCPPHQTTRTNGDGVPTLLWEPRPLDTCVYPTPFELGVREIGHTAADPSKPTVSVTPSVGLSPLVVRILMRVPEPKPEDRELELSVWDKDTELDAPLCRTTRDVLWDTSQTPARATGQTLRATWSIPSGSWVVVGCVKPRGACAGALVVVS